MSEYHLQVSQGKIEKNGLPILENMAFSIPTGKVTVILGPSATGKTLLLQAISDSLPLEIQKSGSWQFKEIAKGLVPPLLPQSKARSAPETAYRLGTVKFCKDWRDVLAEDAPIVFLDEPFSGRDLEEASQFKSALEEKSENQTVILVTHNLGLAQAVADHIVFICAGRIDATGPASTFFANPKTPLAEKFLKFGNCWPEATPPPLPNHFRWILPNQLAGMGRPGLLGEELADLEAIGHAGILHLVSLTEKAFSPKKLISFGIQGRHFPIVDMKVPSLNAAATLIAQMSKRAKDKQPVAYHCKAGLGRTGTILACHLCWDGMSAEDAINLIREKQPGYIQNKTQLDFVYQFANLYCCVNS